MSLFPFLAVLICTMGVLILLLVLVVKQADQKATEASKSESSKRSELLTEIQGAMEDAEVMANGLLEQRTSTLAELEKYRAIRASLDENLSRLRQKIEDLKARKLLVENSNSLESLETLQRKIAERQQMLRREQDALDELRKKQGAPGTFALIAYDGASGTTRRPIYIECTKEGITLQPYGIRLRAEDFTFPILAGNPLDAALAAIRDQYVGNARVTKGQEPYPLIIVRPGGSDHYAIARGAMKSWDSEFGHQVVPEDIELEFPKDDLLIKDKIEKVIAAAKARQTRLAATASVMGHKISKLETDPKSGVVNTAPGSFTNSRAGAGGTSLAGTSAVPTRPNLPPATIDSGSSLAHFAPSGYAMPSGSGNRPQSDQSNSLSNPASPMAERNPYQSASYAPGSSGSSNTFGGVLPPGSGGQGIAGLNSTGGTGTSETPSLNSPTNGSMNGANNELAQANGQAGTGVNTGRTGTEFATNPPPDATSNPYATPNATNQNPPNQQNSGVGQNSSLVQMGQSSSNSQQMNADPNATPMPELNFNQDSNANKSLAAERGASWALPAKSDKGVAFRRAIRVTCYDDRLVIHAGSGIREPMQVIDFSSTTREHVDQLVNIINQRIESWGSAGYSSYWQPELKIEVGVTGATRFQELKSLLSDSGILINENK